MFHVVATRPPRRAAPSKAAPTRGVAAVLRSRGRTLPGGVQCRTRGKSRLASRRREVFTGRGIEDGARRIDDDRRRGLPALLPPAGLDGRRGIAALSTDAGD